MRSSHHPAAAKRSESPAALHYHTVAAQAAVDRWQPDIPRVMAARTIQKII